MTFSPKERTALVAAAHQTIEDGSQSFAFASRLFDWETRERVWLLYAWCRAADDITDGQDLGHNAKAPDNSAERQARLEILTKAALGAEGELPVPFAALRQVAAETRLPGDLVADHLAGFALDAAHWRPESEADLLRYCYYVAGAVGCMMAVVMGVHPKDKDTLNRASDLGLAFQLANIARDLVPDASLGRCYIPAEWLAGMGLSAADIVLPENRHHAAAIAARLVGLTRPYRASARIGAASLPFRARLAVLTADAVYGAIGEKVARLGASAWDDRVRIGRVGKLALFVRAYLSAMRTVQSIPRTGLWTRPI